MLVSGAVKLDPVFCHFAVITAVCDIVYNNNNKIIIIIKKPQTFYWSNSASSTVIGQWNINEIYEIRLNKINSKFAILKQG